MNYDHCKLDKLVKALKFNERMILKAGEIEEKLHVTFIIDLKPCIFFSIKLLKCS